MKALFAALALCLASAPAMAQTVSEYTEYDLEADCSVIGRSLDGEGDWADFVCPGYAGYPFVVRYTDGRESVTYGFATDSGMSTFSPFNYANGTVEWRVRIDRDVEIPVAAIQRWFLADIDGNWSRQILVVSRVGQPDGGGACALGFIDAHAEGANQAARQLADQMAENFACGSDTPHVDETVSDIVPAG